MLIKLSDEKSRLSALDYLKKLNLSKRYTLKITVEKRIRTLSQSRLYWLWLSCISAETGNDKDYLHEYFKGKYLPKDQRVIFGQRVEITISTTSLDTAQFTHYLERIQQFANSELGIVLPNPEDLQWKQFYETYKDFI